MGNDFFKNQLIDKRKEMSVYDCASVSECEKDSRGVEQIVICLLKHKKRYFCPARMGNFGQVFSSFGASSNSKGKMMASM